MVDDAFQPDAITRRAEARVGQVLRNKWRIDRLLGVGGMAAVYAGEHRNGKRGAIKMLHLELAIDEDARRRFLQEGYAANRVDHPGAVSVLDDDVAEDGAVFVVMELLEGRTLDALADAQPDARLDVATVLGITDQVLDVLAAAHDKGIVHRDLKPENLFLTREGQVKVLDFGLARIQEHQPGHATRTGNAMGTPAFMAPEQALGNWSEVDARTDLWAVGASMFTLLTGRLVHQATTVQQLMLAAMTKPAAPLRSVDASLPVAVAEVIDRALRFDRAERWPDARSMQRAVRELLPRAAAPLPLAPLGAATAAIAAQQPSLLGATLPLRPRRGPSAIVGVGALSLIAAAGVTVALLGPWNKAPSPPASAAPLPVASAVATADSVSVTPSNPASAPSASAGSAPSASASVAVSASAAPPPRPPGKPAGSAKKPDPPRVRDPFETWQ